MKTVAVVVGIAMLGLGLSGCCHMRRCCAADAAKGSAACATVCSKCGMPKGTCSCKASFTQMPEITTPALKTLVDSGVPLTLVDARTGKYDDGRRIHGAVNLGPDAKDQEIQNVLKNKEALIVCYCANLQCPASRQLAVRLQQLGYKNVLEYAYGIDGWVADGHPVTQKGK